MQVRFFILVSVLFFAGSAEALELSAAGPGISTTLSISDNYLNYRDDFAKISFPLNSCARKQFQRIEKDILFYQSKPDSGKDKIIQVLLDKTTHSISAESRFAQYLNTLRMDIQSLQIAVKSLCR